MLDLPMQMHGTAEPRGSYLLTTWRAPDNVNTLPEQVELYVYESGGYQFVTRFEETCPDLHGSYSNENHTAFGCSDGVLVVEQSGDNFVATKIANPPGTPTGVRIGTIIGHDEQPNFIGIARPGLFYEIDTEMGVITPISWPGTQQTTSAMADEGNTLLVMDESGTVHVLDGENGWAVKASLPAASGIPEEGSQPTIEAHTSEALTYISDPIGMRIVVVDTESGSVADTIPLDFAPGQIRWLGIAAHEHGDEHDHEGDEHDHEDDEHDHEEGDEHDHEEGEVREE
jgi:hypothetical protein